MTISRWHALYILRRKLIYTVMYCQNLNHNSDALSACQPVPHKQSLTTQLKPANALLSNMVNFYRYTMLTMFIFAIFTGISDFYENPYLCNQISIYIFQCIKIGITLTINQSSNISESQRTEAMMNNWNSGYKNSKNPILPWSTPGRNYPDLSSGSIIHSTSNNIV